MIISRHVVFNELVFSFVVMPSGASLLEFLLPKPSSTMSVDPSLGVEQLPSSSIALPFSVAQ